MVDGEWHLITATHNLLKLFLFRRSKQQVLMERIEVAEALEGGEWLPGLRLDLAEIWEG